MWNFVRGSANFGRARASSTRRRNVQACLNAWLVRRPRPAMKPNWSTKKSMHSTRQVDEFYPFLWRKAPFWVPPDRLPRRAVRGLGAHSPHQSSPLIRVWHITPGTSSARTRIACLKLAVQPAIQAPVVEGSIKMTYADRAAETNGPIYRTACLHRPRARTDSCRPRRKVSYGKWLLDLAGNGCGH
jgi:hypothetical protein